MSKFATRFLKDDSGATTIEYGLIAMVEDNRRLRLNPDFNASPLH